MRLSVKRRFLASVLNWMYERFERVDCYTSYRYDGLVLGDTYFVRGFEQHGVFVDCPEDDIYPEEPVVIGLCVQDSTEPDNRVVASVSCASRVEAHQVLCSIENRWPDRML